VQLVAYVINLPERNERWKLMKTNWSHIFDKIVRVNGIRSPIPHAGCALAHISAIKLAFCSEPGKPAIILEDDIIPHPSLTRETFLHVFMEASRVSDHYDAIYFKPMCHTIITFRETESLLFYDFEPTLKFFCNAFMMYSPRLRFLEEYENHLLTEKIVVPIDRLFSSDSFWGFFYNKPVSWFCTKLQTNLMDLGSDNTNGDPSFSQHSIYIETPKYIEFCLQHKKPKRKTNFQQIINFQNKKSESALPYWCEDEEDGKKEKWVPLGNEHDKVTLDTKCILRYGTNDCWIEKEFFPGIYILNNEQFQCDPVEGKRKRIEKLTSL